MKKVRIKEPHNFLDAECRFNSTIVTIRTNNVDQNGTTLEIF